MSTYLADQTNRLAAPEPRTLNQEPSTEPSRKLPPTERDFEIYEAVHIVGCSTWSQARKHQISQTRVRQIVRRVVEWLGEVLPPQTKVAKEQETHLARQIAAGRFQRQYEDATRSWDMTQESKYASIRMRITTAQARLGVVGGILDGLAADAIEGIPVPVYVPPPETVREGEAPAEPNREDEPNPKSKIENQKWFPTARDLERSKRSRWDVMPRELNVLYIDEITPEIVAAREAWGLPINSDIIQQAKKHGKAWPRPAVESKVGPSGPDGPEPRVGGPSQEPVALEQHMAPSHPNEDFSADDNDFAISTPQADTAADETDDHAATYDNTTMRPSDASTNESQPDEPLLRTSEQLPVTVVQITPIDPGAHHPSESITAEDAEQRGGNQEMTVHPLRPSSPSAVKSFPSGLNRRSRHRLLPTGRPLHRPTPSIRIPLPTALPPKTATAMPRHFTLSLLTSALLCLSVAASDWPQFRGEHSSGKAIPEGPLPTDIGPEKHVVWKTELPPGHSSPAIVGDKIFLTAVRDKEHLETICLDRGSGKIVWRLEAPHKTLEQIHGIGSYAQPSPAADGERVVVLFGSSGLYCYDHAGNPQWHQPMGPFNDEFGAAASPIIDADRVLLAQDHDTGSFVAAYDKRSGREIWRTDRSEFVRGYATPVVWTVEGKKQIVVAGSLRVVGYDYDTGRESWTVRGLSRVVCMTPVIGEDNTLFAAGWSAGGDPGDRIRMEPFADYMSQFDENKNGTLETSEVGNSAALKTRFAQCDRDKDGHITREEYDTFEMLFDKSQNGVMAIKPGGRGDVSESHKLWQYEKFAPFCASPLFYQDRIFIVKDGGILTCLDAKAGQAKKSGRVMGTTNYYASPVAGDGKLYLLSQRGTLSVVSAADQWQVIHSTEFGEEGFATPALLDGRIYLRTSGHLYCFGL